MDIKIKRNLSNCVEWDWTSTILCHRPKQDLFTVLIFHIIIIIIIIIITLFLYFVCFFFSTRARLVIGLWAVKFALNWIICKYYIPYTDFRRLRNVCSDFTKNHKLYFLSDTCLNETLIFRNHFPASQRLLKFEYNSRRKSVNYTVSNTFDCSLLHAVYLLSLHFDPEDGGNMFFWNIRWLSPDYTALYPRRYNFSQPPLNVPQT
jgi:hypothetical protein